MSNVEAINLKAYFNKGGEELDFTGKRCVLAISVGQEYHEEQKLSSTVHLINKSGFSQVKVVVADTLQRHNKHGKSPGEALSASIRDGDAWLARNRKYLAGLEAPVSISRWNQELASDRYADLRQQVNALYRDSEDLRGAIESTIGVFIERLRLRDPEADLERAAAQCREYILEEVPIILPQWAQEGYDYVIYPQQMTHAMAEARRLLIEPHAPERVHWLPLKFKKRGIPIPFNLPGAAHPAWAGSAIAI
ncbi:MULTISPECIES: tRNA-dependent cyclodipeptide synthase [Pseudomonas]|uniref:tRNA-dependent cyclodipeptide synthase n=1 Tax=Pseudomonas TaxID=286 RepID=UPI001E4B4922|nr:MULTISPECIES: tRNA-dependent cyclodipeptide synthase [Pseudomonas]MCE1114381.1 tRNA-dependent cyclodipeptide synthase [Pseudomonas sp. NMI795_08]